jgi:hypothetical protein
MSSNNAGPTAQGAHSATELRLQLLRTGIEVLPSTVSKEVFLKNWRNRPIDEGEIRS